MTTANLPYVSSDEDDEAPATGASDEAVVEDDRDDLIKAAEEALKNEKPEEAKVKTEERDEKGRFLKPPVTKPAAEKLPTSEKPSSLIARELEKREQKREEESAYKTRIAEAEATLERAKSVAQRLEAREKELDARERDVDDFVKSAQRDPMAAMKRMGWTAEQFIENAQRSRDPAYQEAQELRQELAKRDAAIAELRSGLEDLQGVRKKYDEQGKAQEAQAELQAFWASIPQDSPVWSEYEDEDDVVYQARKVRQQYFDRTGKVASPQQVGEYLHYRALKKRGDVPAESAGRKPGQAGQPKAKVPRALGSSDASERRSGGAKHIHDMTPEEERAYLADVAASALAAGDD